MLERLVCFFKGHDWWFEPRPGVSYVVHGATLYVPKRCIRCGKRDPGRPIPKPPPVVSQRHGRLPDGGLNASEASP